MAFKRNSPFTSNLAQPNNPQAQYNYAGSRDNAGQVNVAEQALAQRQAAHDQFLKTGAVFRTGSGVLPLGPETFAYNPSLALQIELSNLGAAFESYAMGEGMAGSCGWGSGGSGASGTDLKQAAAGADAKGADGLPGSRVNSIWKALNRSLYRARLFQQGSDQSTPETDDPLFPTGRNLPRTLSVRRMRRQ